MNHQNVSYDSLKHLTRLPKTSHIIHQNISPLTKHLTWLIKWILCFCISKRLTRLTKNVSHDSLNGSRFLKMMLSRSFTLLAYIFVLNMGKLKLCMFHNADSSNLYFENLGFILKSIFRLTYHSHMLLKWNHMFS